jgi:hypothetical protein
MSRSPTDTLRKQSVLYLAVFEDDVRSLFNFMKENRILNALSQYGRHVNPQSARFEVIFPSCLAPYYYKLHDRAKEPTEMTNINRQCVRILVKSSV